MERTIFNSSSPTMERLSSPQKMQPPLSLQSVANFLLEQGLHLTALELRQEIIESSLVAGIMPDVPLELDDFFEDESFFRMSVPTTLENGLIAPEAVLPFVSPPDAPEPVFDSLLKREQRIAQLEYELRCALEDLESAKLRLSNSAKEEVSPHCQSTSPKSGSISTSSGSGGHARSRSGLRLSAKDFLGEMGLQAAEKGPQTPAQASERAVLNGLVKSYMVESGYRLSAITFTDEAGHQDLEGFGISWRKELEKPGALLTLYRDRIGSNRDLLETEAELNSLKEKLLVSSAQIEQLEKENSKLIEEMKNMQMEEFQSVAKQVVIPEMPTLAEKKRDDVPDNMHASETDGEEGAYESGSADACIQFKAKEPRVYAEGASLKTVYQLKKDPEKVVEISANVVAAVQDVLPQICLHIPDRHRAVILPLLFSLLTTPNEDVLDLLFDLIPDPTLAQRSQLVQGLVEVMQFVSKEWLQSVLFPRITGLLENKSNEQRMLAVDLSVHLATAIPDSDILAGAATIISQAIEDTADVVRVAAVTGLSALMPHCSQKTMLDTIPIIFKAVQSETSTLVIKEVDSLLIPSIIELSAKFSCLFSDSLPAVLAAFHAAIMRHEADTDEGWCENPSQNEHLTPSLFSWLGHILELVCKKITENGLYLGNSKALVFSLSEDSEGQSQLLSGHESFRALLRGRARVIPVGGDFTSQWDNDSSESDTSFSEPSSPINAHHNNKIVGCEGFAWIANQLLPSIFRIISKALPTALNQVGAPIQALCMGFGVEFASLVVLPQMVLVEGIDLSQMYPIVLSTVLRPENALRDFSPLIQIVRSQEGFAELPNSATEPFEVFRALFFASFDQNVHKVTGAVPSGWRSPKSRAHRGLHKRWQTLRALVIGVCPVLAPDIAKMVLHAILDEISTCEEEEKENGLQEFIAGYSHLYSLLQKREKFEGEVPPTAFVQSKEEARSIQLTLLGIPWDLSHDENPVNIMIAIRLFGALVGLMDPAQVIKRILPAVVSLSGNIQPMVIRQQAIRVLGMMYNSLEDSFLAKVNAEVESLLKDGDFLIEMEILGVFSSCMTTCSPAQRNGFIIDQIVASSERLQTQCRSSVISTNTATLADILRKLYHQYYGCMVPDSPKERLLAGLEALLGSPRVLKLSAKAELQALLDAVQKGKVFSPQQVTSPKSSRFLNQFSFEFSGDKRDEPDIVHAQNAFSFVQEKRLDPDIPPSKRS